MAATRSQSLSFLTRSITVKPVPLGSDTKKTVIFEAELIAFCCSHNLMARPHSQQNPCSLLWTTTALPGVCISGKVRNAIGHQLITLLLAAKDLAGLNTWIARVLALRTLLIFYPEKTQKKFLSDRKRIKASSVEKTIKAILE